MIRILTLMEIIQDFFESGERTGEVSLSFNDGIYTGATKFANFRRLVKETTL